MKNLLSIILLSLLLTSCKKGFLTLNPQSEANAENYYKTAKDFNTALIGAYARFTDYPTMYFELSSYRSDELSLGAPTAGTQDRYNIDKFADDPSNQILLNVWGNLYNGISRCNEIIARLQDTSLSDVQRSQIEAEARFIRAYHYYHLVKFWGNVPLITHPVSPSESLRAGSVPSDQILSTLAEDLRFARENLPERFAGEADLGRATSGTATVLLAKVLMEKKTMQKYNAY
ncbi:RagB/SusD family nutrient uptake outer membrane protein [Pedobacter sp. P26]|uniref:RagB/SusD family nutrient uptake outer membrane protein n=1 Tax=Pedobacter sp. P26 TaxID=3423956 RepID=UPI003D668C16